MLYAEEVDLKHFVKLLDVANSVMNGFKRKMVFMKPNEFTKGIFRRFNKKKEIEKIKKRILSAQHSNEEISDMLMSWVEEFSNTEE